MDLKTASTARRKANCSTVFGDCPVPGQEDDVPKKPIVILVVVLAVVIGLIALAILAIGNLVLPPDLPSSDPAVTPDSPRPASRGPAPVTHSSRGAEHRVKRSGKAPQAPPRKVEAIEASPIAAKPPTPPAAPPVSSIHGIVTDASARPRPVADARVVLTGAPGKAVAVTDESGRFRFTPLPPGNYVIRAFHADFAPWVRKGSGQRIVLAENASYRVAVTLEAGVKVEGIVIARDGSGPVGGARVTMVRGEYDRFVTSTTRPDGSFTFAHFPLLPPNERPFPIEVRAEGFAPRYVCVRTRKSNENHRLEIRLDRGAGLAGVVLDSSGLPLCGVDVRCKFRYRYVKEFSEITGRTDNLGRYRLNHLPRGYTIQVWAFKKGYRPSYLNLIVNGHAPQKIMRPLRLKRLTDL
jgi:hypothetical protein